jgi:upstream activation factor subunit UAF30
MPSKAAAKKTTETPVVEVAPVETKKTKTTKAAATTEPAPVVAKKETKPRSKKDTTPVETTTTETPVVENVVVATDTTETSITDNFTEFIQKFQGMLSQFSSLKTELRNLERKTVKQLKVVQKLNNKKRKKGTRAPSGFVKPSLISDELATFLGRDKGSEMARTDVTREINKYIRANNLQDKENGRKINADAPLKALLKIDDEVALTYFNLQRYMGPHFPKQTKAAPVVEA